jgi:hypothetical protein
MQAAVCRNAQGCILCTTSQPSLHFHPNYGEAFAAKLDHFMLESDLQVVLSARQNLVVTQDWSISSIIMRTLWSIPAYSS